MAKRGNPDVINGKIGVRFTSETAKANGAKGGKKSGESKREKKLLKECLEILLEQQVKVKDSNDTVSGAEAVSLAVFKQALNGNIKAFETLRDTVGQKPVEKIMLTEVTQDVIEEVEAIMNEQD